MSNNRYGLLYNFSFVSLTYTQLDLFSLFNYWGAGNGFTDLFFQRSALGRLSFFFFFFFHRIVFIKERINSALRISFSFYY